jgi:hypothetical protein
MKTLWTMTTIVSSTLVSSSLADEELNGTRVDSTSRSQRDEHGAGTLA